MKYLSELFSDIRFWFGAIAVAAVLAIAFNPLFSTKTAAQETVCYTAEYFAKTTSMNQLGEIPIEKLFPQANDGSSVAVYSLDDTTVVLVHLDKDGCIISDDDPLVVPLAVLTEKGISFA